MQFFLFGPDVLSCCLSIHSEPKSDFGASPSNSRRFFCDPPVFSPLVFACYFACPRQRPALIHRFSVPPSPPIVVWEPPDVLFSRPPSDQPPCPLLYFGSLGPLPCPRNWSFFPPSFSVCQQSFSCQVLNVNVAVPFPRYGSLVKINPCMPSPSLSLYRFNFCPVLLQIPKGSLRGSFWWTPSPPPLPPLFSHHVFCLLSLR